jgi:crotonobetainyl-CoA:carnitine CoA-transferase CaiB-like acyl-CoA transferase
MLLNSYQCQDGRWIFIAAPSERAWPALCAGLELDSIAADPRFQGFAARWTNRAELFRLLEERFAARDAADWERRMAVQPGLVFEIVRRPTEIGTDPQGLANGYVASAEHPELGPIKRVTMPVHLNGARPAVADAAPILGQHTEEVLMTMLGLTWEELRDLHKKGVL